MEGVVLINNLRDEKGKFIPKHNMKNTKIYGVWCSMKERCNNSKNKSYKNYGKKGIKVCNEWQNDFLSFYNWAIENGYKEKLTIDRINVNGNYEPKNCRWVTTKQQNRNYSRNHKIIYKEKEYCLIELSEIFNIPYSRLVYRINSGMDIEKAILNNDYRSERKWKNKKQ